MSIESPNDEVLLEAKTSKNIEKGISTTLQLAEAKLKEKKSMVVIVVTGEPNAGKTFFMKNFLEKARKDIKDGIHFNAKGAIAFSGVARLQQDNTQDNPTLPTEYLVVEGVGNIDLLKLQAKNLGLDVDISIYIYNPHNTQYISESKLRDTNIIIENPDSQIK